MMEDYDIQLTLIIAYQDQKGFAVVRPGLSRGMPTNVD